MSGITESTIARIAGSTFGAFYTLLYPTVGPTITHEDVLKAAAGYSVKVARLIAAEVARTGHSSSKLCSDCEGLGTTGPFGARCLYCHGTGHAPAEGK